MASRADPLNILEFSEDTLPETIGWFRHAEIKHGRVAMAAFVGYIVQANGIHFPWDISNGVSYASISAAGSPPMQWDALSTEGKWQIILAVGFLEWWSELRLVPGEAHYMKGGKPGYFPPFSDAQKELPHPMPLDLYVLRFLQNASPEQKAGAALRRSTTAASRRSASLASCPSPLCRPSLPQGCHPVLHRRSMVPFKRLASRSVVRTISAIRGMVICKRYRRNIVTRHGGCVLERQREVERLW